MESTDGLRVNYDAKTKRVEVKYGDRRVSVPGKFETLDEARAAAEVYACRYLGKK
jgi:hypothetical protein